mmetsp:Transcript_128137/g.273204  ORF Transcript_128137/g.273204 Transcript_128137/m.273204 type:complete len:213 (+) Transcript_128137:838-1476(+)
MAHPCSAPTASSTQSRLSWTGLPVTLLASSKRTGLMMARCSGRLRSLCRPTMHRPWGVWPGTLHYRWCNRVATRARRGARRASGPTTRRRVQSSGPSSARVRRNLTRPVIKRAPFNVSLTGPHQAMSQIRGALRLSTPRVQSTLVMRTDFFSPSVTRTVMASCTAQTRFLPSTQELPSWAPRAPPLRPVCLLSPLAILCLCLRLLMRERGDL